MDGARAPLLEIIAFLEAERARGAEAIELDVLDPDLGRGRYAGEPIELDAATVHDGDLGGGPDAVKVRELDAATVPDGDLGGDPDASNARELDGRPVLHRPFRTWVDLAERLGLRLCTPRPLAASHLRLRFEPLDRLRSACGTAARPGRAGACDRGAQVRGADEGTEKYGTASDFARVDKREDPSFVVDMRDALERIAPQPTWRVLYLGCNAGDEVALVRALSPALRGATHVGIDHSASAIAAARARFNEGTIAFHEADVAAFAALGLGRFDLVLSIGTLQSAGIDDRDLLRQIVQDHLAPRGALILGMPNCRYVDGEVEYGARMKNFRQPELGLLVKDVAFYRKYLQQHHKQVFVTGKHYLLVTAVDAREGAAGAAPGE